MKRIAFDKYHDFAKQIQAIQATTELDLQHHSHIAQCDPKEILIQVDSEVSTLYFLLDGKAKVYKLHEDGKQTLIHFVSAQEMIGELSLLGVENESIQSPSSTAHWQNVAEICQEKESEM